MFGVALMSYPQCRFGVSTLNPDSTDEWYTMTWMLRPGGRFAEEETTCTLMAFADQRSRSTTDAIHAGPRKRTGGISVPRSRTFQDVLAYLESHRTSTSTHLRVAPKLAEQGRASVRGQLFSRCHGTYGDRANLSGDHTCRWTRSARTKFACEGVSRAESSRVVITRAGLPTTVERDTNDASNPQAYVAPPLDGIWASALRIFTTVRRAHAVACASSGSSRPSVWKRSENGYDQAAGRPGRGGI